MIMSPLSFVLTIASVIFLFFAIDWMQRRKFHFLHFLIFFWGSLLILAFVFIPWFQEGFSRVFWVARWADLIVYSTLIVLWYFYFELLHEVTKQKSQTSRVITAEAIRPVVVAKAHSNSEKEKFLFLVRSYNEASSVWNIIDEIIWAWFSKIFVVNDGSADNTIEVVHEAIKRHPDASIYLFSHLINRGWGAANKTGFAAVQKFSNILDVNWIVTFDADWQMDILDMNSYIAEIHNPANKLVKAFLGTRFANWWSATNMPAWRKVILWWSKLVTRLFNRLNVSDPHNWYRVLHKDIISKLHITSDWMMYASELLDSIRIHDIPFVEVPVHIKYTDYSMAKGQKNRNAIKILAELIYKKIFYK